jgi:predicted TIM-barrel fold metal-dependent hydrolase
METVNFFDSSCIVGRRNIVDPGSFYKTEDLVRKMEHYGVEKAMVYHSMAREYDPQTGNDMLMDEIKGYKQLYPVWVVMQHHTGEVPAPAELAVEMKRKGIKAVRMFPAPTDLNFSIAEWNCGELFSMLEKYRIPLFIGSDQINWNEVHALLKDHPQLRLVLTDVGYRCNRNLYATFEKFENIYIETFSYKVHRGIEEICKRFGAGRLIFGSGMPVYSAGSAASMIRYANISIKEKQMIAGENLEKLLGGVCL